MNRSSETSFRPLSSLQPQESAQVRFVLADIDDTLTEEGKLLPESFTALWDLSRAGYRVVPVTGRPAGWCDMIIRQWPVDAVVGENGAFVYYNEVSWSDGRSGTDGRSWGHEHSGDTPAAEESSGPYKTFVHPSVASGDIAARLGEVEREVFRRVPGVRRAKDQPFRIYDLAIDFCEDSPKLGLDTAQRVADICRELGAKAKISSIHVNTWFGDYDKLDTTLRFLEKFHKTGREEAKQRVFFCGDSPNDEPMFSCFPLSCGVANVKQYSSIMQHQPAFIADNSYGYGFAELAGMLSSFTHL